MSFIIRKPTADEKIDALLAEMDIAVVWDEEIKRFATVQRGCGTCADADKDCCVKAGHIICKKWRYE